MDEKSKKVAIGIPRETFPGEHRVAIIPSTIPELVKSGMEVMVEAGAGVSAGFMDSEYTGKGALMVSDRSELFKSVDIILQVRALGANPDEGKLDFKLLREGQVLVSQCDPFTSLEMFKELAKRNVVSFAMELIPRITRAQAMDVLSSMATVAGYKAVLIAADKLPRMFPMLMTAAGTITPARVFVIGAGVAGLQAIAVAKRLGAVVHAYDVRPAVKEQVQSLGAKFVELELEPADSEDKGGYAKSMDEEFYNRQREMMARVVKESNVVITTAAVPGKKAPVLITREMVQGMAPGSVIVDLAAERGGNCELTQPDETIVENGVTVLGPTNLPSTIPYHSSQMYSRNISTFLLQLVKDGELKVDMEDQVIAETLVTYKGEIVNERLKELFNLVSGPCERNGA